MPTIAIGQMEVIPGRPDLNTQTMLQMIDEARRQRAQIIVFPALCLSGSHIGNMWEQQAFLMDCQRHAKQIIESSFDIIIVFGNVAVDQQETGILRRYDALFIANNGSLIKPDNSPFQFLLRQLDSNRYFTGLRQLSAETGQRPEDLQSTASLCIGEKTVALGCLACDTNWHLEGITGMETKFVAPDAADLLVHIAANPFTLGHSKKRRAIMAELAAEKGIPLLYVNNVGVQNNGKTVYTYDGDSTAYNNEGEIITRSGSFNQILSCIQTDSSTKCNTYQTTLTPAKNNIADIFQALHYGAEKFLKQTGIERIVIGASGGIDSAVSAALYTKVLGPDQVLLVNMPGIYNSQTTRDLASVLASNLGCRYTVMPIQESVDHTVKQINETPITHFNDGMQSHLAVTSQAAENIQARDRSARILAGLAASFGGAFVCNANKSEITIGYSTLYGDLSGCLAPLADLWKHQVYQLAEYINQHVYQREVIPQKTIDIVPSAELSSAQSVDEGNGDPLHYPYHDYLFKSFMENPRPATPEDILEWYRQDRLEEEIGCSPGLVKRLFPSPKDFIADLERWWKLYTGLAAAKRIQSPPILAISRRAYGQDHQEAQNGPYFTARYLEIKEEVNNTDCHAEGTAIVHR